MEIRDNDNICIFAPLGERLDKYESERLINEISKETRQIGIDLKYVYDCTIDFIELLKESSKLKQIAIFNIPSDIFVLFNIMKLDKVVNLYVSENDFESHTRRIINRQFELV
ncbi:MAG: hypothetical protein MJ230_01990 [bacterium]|nr:hypothetical protein [bacterium]